jgi:hypothetical protein
VVDVGVVTDGVSVVTDGVSGLKDSRLFNDSEIFFV